MTKVSWKRILQRAGNEFPSTGHEIAERPRQQATVRRPLPASRAAEPPSLVAGELETELRRALQRQQGSPAREKQEWDPIFMAQELRNEPLMPVPYEAYNSAPPKKRGVTTRNILAVSLSAVVVGFAVQQIGDSWRDSNGGGGGGSGGNGGGGQHQQTESASIAAPLKVKDQAKLVQTGYAIQPLISPGVPVDLEPSYSTPKLGANEPVIAPQEKAASDAAAMFQRDMEEARKLFESKEEANARPSMPTPVAAPVTPSRATITTPVTSAAVTPAAVAPAAKPSTPVAPVAVNPSAKTSAINGAEENKLLARANDLMQRGDITGARLLFEHLAFRGSALGAFALAQSYDPKHLQKLYVRGLTPDQKQADYWYRKAAELGGSQRGSNGR
jgi:hypothetical protein